MDTADDVDQMDNVDQNLWVVLSCVHPDHIVHIVHRAGPNP